MRRKIRPYLLCQLLALLCFLYSGCATTLVTNGGFLWSDSGYKEPKPEAIALAVAIDTVTLPIQVIWLFPEVLFSAPKALLSAQDESVCSDTVAHPEPTQPSSALPPPAPCE
jgi:hypothetical protein